MRKTGLLLVLILTATAGFTQPVEVPLFYPVQTQAVHAVALHHDTTHVTYAPLSVNRISDPSRIPGFIPDSSKHYSWFTQKLFKESLLILNKPGIYFTLDIIFDFGTGIDISDTLNRQMYQNTRGLMIKGHFGKKVAIYTSFLENQARYPDYVTKFVNNNDVIPGSGRVKVLDKDAFDYAMATAYITWDAARFLRIKLGTDKDFIGTGYRSILLSDNAFNYPHLRFDFRFAKNRIQYTLNYALLQTLSRLPKGETPESLFERKTGVFHHLSYKPVPNFEIGLFNGVVMPFSAQGENAGYYVNFLMPVIFWNAAVNAGEQRWVQKIGLDASWFPGRNWNVYLQANIGISNNPPGLMVGVKRWDLFTRNLNVAFEFSHVDNTDLTPDTVYAFSHYNQSLAHPLGSGFYEAFFKADYRLKRRFYFKIDYAFSMRSLKDAAYWGFIDQSQLSGEKVLIQEPTAVNHYFNFEFQYMFNQKTNMNVAAGFTGRSSGQDNIFGQTRLFYVAFRTSLRNIYLDF